MGLPLGQARARSSGLPVTRIELLSHLAVEASKTQRHEVACQGYMARKWIGFNLQMFVKYASPCGRSCRFRL